MKALFQNLGLTHKEQEVFIKMLPLGAQPASVIAKHVDVPRTSAYVVLERLKQLNLVEEFTRNGISYFKCIPVADIADLLKAQSRKIRQTLIVFKETLPGLMKLENKLSITPTVKFFEGKKAVMKLYEDVLKENEFCAFFNPKLVKKIMPEYYYKVAQTIQARGGKAREMILACPEAVEYQELFNSSRHQIKILPARAVFSSDTIITESKIYMISYGEREVCGTEIY